MKQFYILDASCLGVSALWWRPERCGYTVRLDEAGVYSEDDALSIAKIRGTDVPCEKSMVDALAYRTVDVSALPCALGRVRR